MRKLNFKILRYTLYFPFGKGVEILKVTGGIQGKFKKFRSELMQEDLFFRRSFGKYNRPRDT
jgi:hypothetical protein